MQTKKVFELWSKLFEEEPKAWSRFSGRYRWVVKGDGGGNWIMESGLRPRIAPDEGSIDADLEIKLSAECFRGLVLDGLNPQLAVINKEILINGKTKHALRFNLLLDALLDVANDYSRKEQRLLLNNLN